MKAFLNYIYEHQAKHWPARLTNHLPLPKALLQKARTQVRSITVPAS